MQHFVYKTTNLFHFKSIHFYQKEVADLLYVLPWHWLLWQRNSILFYYQSHPLHLVISVRVKGLEATRYAHFRRQIPWTGPRAGTVAASTHLKLSPKHKTPVCLLLVTQISKVSSLARSRALTAQKHCNPTISQSL